MKSFRIVLMVVLVLLFACVPVVASAETIPAETEAVVLPDNMTDEDVNEMWESVKDNVSKFTVWLTAFMSTSGVAIIALVVKWGIGKIFEKIAENAKNTDIKLDDKLVAHREEIVTKVNASIDSMAAALIDVEKKVATTTANEEKMFAIMSIAFLNTVHSESAKAEIMELLSDIKHYDGGTEAIVKKAQESIEKAKEDVETPTPTLDALVLGDTSAEPKYIRLG